MNSILVVTPNASVFDEVEKWLARLDQPQQTAGRRNFVYKLRHARAADIQAVLAQLYGSVAITYGPSTGAPAEPQQAGTPSPQTAQPVQPVQGGQLQPAVPQAVPAVQAANVRIIADQINNALVIQATPQVYAEIESTLQILDVHPKQVLIDAQIYEVALNDSMSLGISAILQNRGTLNPATTASFAATAGGSPDLRVSTFAFIGRTRELLLFLNASENRSRVRTLSAPSVLVRDNLQAEFQVGAEVPIPTSSSVTPVQAGGTNLFAQTIQFRDTGVILRVKPQINEGGSVTLTINQEVSQATANTTSGIVAPVIGKSSVSSTIVVDDGQTIALGGFIRESTNAGADRVPGLGRIPGLGLLFGTTSRSKVRSELVILITPHVLTSGTDGDLATEELKQRLNEVKKLMK